MKSLYRAALLADLHGNLDALNAVMADAETHHPDSYVFSGDLAMNGLYPAKTLDYVMESGAPAVIGNTDEEILAASDPVAQWAAQKLRPHHLDFLRMLPLSHHVTPPGGRSPEDDLLVVHSTPRSCFDLLILAPHPLGTTFTQTTPMNEALQMLQRAKANLIVYGHIHYVSEASLNGQRVMSIGSVGYPFDGDQRAAYALADWDGQNWNITHKRVSYDYEGVAARLLQSDMPFAGRYAAMIRAANWFPRP